MTTPNLDRLVESTWSRIVTRWLFPAVLTGLGWLVWDDVKSTLSTVQLIQFQQIKDGKDIERHAEQIRDIELRLRAKGIKEETGLYDAGLQ